jgi:hypothetical protein
VKGATLERLAKRYLVPVFPEFAARGSLLFGRDPEMLLYGVSFDTSGFEATSVCLEAFVQPLFVPSDHLVFTFGSRLRSSDGTWDFSRDSDELMRDVANAITSEALPLFERASTLARFADKAGTLVSTEDNPVVLEPLGYAHILLGQPDAAIPKLERARDLEREAIYPCEERVRRIESILQTLDEGRLDQATERLNYWRTETLGALRLIQVAA